MEYKTYRCPEGHFVPGERWNFAKEDLEERDADGRRMFERGVFCHQCDRAYGLSKLEEVE